MSYVEIEQYESSATRRIYGKIVDKIGNGIGSAVVTFYGFSTITDSWGNFEILNPAYVSGSFKVTATGYDNLEHAITSPYDGQALYIKVVMTLIPPPPPPPSGYEPTDHIDKITRWEYKQWLAAPNEIHVYDKYIKTHMSDYVSAIGNVTGYPISIKGPTTGSYGIYMYYQFNNNINPNDIVPILGPQRIPLKYVSVSIKNTGSITWTFGVELKIIKSSLVGASCGLTGDTIYTTSRVYTDLSPSQIKSVQFQVPDFGLYVTAKVYGNGICLDGDYAGMR